MEKLLPQFTRPWDFVEVQDPKLVLKITGRNTRGLRGIYDGDIGFYGSKIRRSNSRRTRLLKEVPAGVARSGAGELLVRVYFRRELKESGTIGYSNKFFQFETFFRGSRSSRLNFLMQGSSDLIIEAHATPEGFKILYADATSRKPDQRGVLNFWRTAKMPDNTPIDQTNIEEEYLRELRRECNNRMKKLGKELAQLKKAQEEVQERRKALHQSWLTLKD
ncbi:hypothetical protein CAEBREN_01343 [Caenorhabditis brenneri]|uniref:Uncharacterized protein n=1 Tax=Caenorhabditis brenneri TaxID=135651 RepID=G0MFY5_CAEBE|nr:hypothetical protein CAEBREN_01343 [Caenorhabditis brenneri]